MPERRRARKGASSRPDEAPASAESRLVPEPSLPARYLEHFGPLPLRADRTGPAIPSPYRARDDSPHFLPEEVTYLRFRTPSWPWIVLAFSLSALLLSPAAAVLATLWDPARGLRAVYREDRTAAVLGAAVVMAGLMGGVLLVRQAGRWTADRLAARRGTRRWGLYLFPDALVVRWPGGHGATCLPRAAIHGFAYQTFSQAHPDSALVKGANEPDLERWLYVGLRQAQGVRWIWLDEPEAYRGKGDELAEDLNHWAQTGVWSPRPVDPARSVPRQHAHPAHPGVESPRSVDPARSVPRSITGRDARSKSRFDHA